MTKGTVGSISPARRAMLAVLAAHGPISGEAAAAKLGWTLERWWQQAGNCLAAWDVTGKGLVLTEKGRKALAALAESESKPIRPGALSRTA